MRYRIFVFVGFIVFLNGCKSPEEKAANKRENLHDVETTQEPKFKLPEVTYRLVSFKTEKDTDAGWMETIAALNRIDFAHLMHSDTVVVPDSFYTDLMMYSPFPPVLPFLKDIKKLIFYSYRIQAFGAYENGRLIRWGPVSMGKKSTPTPLGLFHTNWRSKKTVSTVDDEWIMEWYFNLENRQGVSMHEYDLPGYPASHACVRLAEKDAIWFYNWCETWLLNKDKWRSLKAYGTPVIIFGNYAWGEKKPWLLLPENNKALKFTESDLKAETEKFLPTILSRQSQRDSIEALTSGQGTTASKE